MSGAAEYITEYKEKTEYLNRYVLTTEKVHKAALCVEEMQTQATHITANWSAAPAGHGNNDVLGRNVERVIAAKNELAALLDKQMRARDDLLRLIETEPNPQAQIILRQRYILGYTFSDSAAALEQTARNIMRVHKRTVQAMQIPSMNEQRGCKENSVNPERN